MLKITGYSDKFSARPGSSINFHIHSEGSKNYTADIVRLIHGDTNPLGPGFKEHLINSNISGEYEGREQPIYNGSFAIIPGSKSISNKSVTLAALIYATTSKKGEQAIISKCLHGRPEGFELYISNKGKVEFKIGINSGQQIIRSNECLQDKVWYFIAASFNSNTGEAKLLLKPCVTSSNGANGPRVLPTSCEEESISKGVFQKEDLLNCSAPLLIAASTEIEDSDRSIQGGHYKELEGSLRLPKHTAKFNGKIERPLVAAKALEFSEVEKLCLGRLLPKSEQNIIGLWDFSANISPNASSCSIKDVGPMANHGVLVNLPCRGVTGQSWVDSMNYAITPEEFGAIYFHDDDMDDARWKIDFTYKIPDDLPSGCYAARLRIDSKSDAEHEDYIPFFVRPSFKQKPAPIALIIPTASYMAYANDNLNMESPIAQLITGRVTSLQPSDLLFNELQSMGYGLYGTHTDGSGVSISSRLRPILNMRPKYQHFLSPSVRQYNADLHLVDWLTEKGYSFDVHTDENVTAEGIDLLKGYKVVLTGSHPEYQTEYALDAYQAYQDSGGRMLYLGGNGFYWVTNFHPDNPNIIEVRRGDNGTRAWTISPGEYCGMFDGKHGGIWRVRGRNMAKLVGVSFTAFGLDVCTYYRRSPDSRDSACSWIFDGIADDVIGDFGLVGGGAAGFEIDRYDLDLGTPQNAYLLASSEGHTDMYMCVTEEVSFNFRGYYGSGGGGDKNPLIRADMVFFKTPNDGAVFSVGSIAYCGSLSHNNYNNNISTLTANVIDGFLKKTSLP